ncbi:hypothetical protein BV394_14615 [Brevirhabdus pacifica]|uniref:Uncharacterized protein n=1 Tax=Brevirhabdus pacifica TaxID=1267768 RepID=A0A1U7DLD9_9RHOB|nr:hypothetical protein [Brevirhabdus pacifica]APX90792.1 hypothetical protein BV394_14615 [Brevirhabdus pacifica]OWU79575.1 hypothetical protein ATO5_00315 [Loktanella sp. 22II-4b]PJJ87325.1 hypothetical protein CLV77_1893 [Brevirhabdus pacifica]
MFVTFTLAGIALGLTAGTAVWAGGFSLLTATLVYAFIGNLVMALIGILFDHLHWRESSFDLFER